MGVGWNWSVENTLNYKFDVKDEHHFDVLLGQSFQKSGFGMGEDMSATASTTLFGNWNMAYLSNSTASNPREATGAPWGDSALSFSLVVLIITGKKPIWQVLLCVVMALLFLVVIDGVFFHLLRWMGPH